MNIQSEDIAAAKSICEQIENKFLERGTFSKYCDGKYDLSFKPVFENGEYNFGLIISIQTDDDCNIDSELAEELLDSAKDKFFEVLALEYSDETNNRLIELFDNSSFIVNDDVIY